MWRTSAFLTEILNALLSVFSSSWFLFQKTECIMLHKHIGPNIIVQKIQKHIAKGHYSLIFFHLHVVPVFPCLLSNCLRHIILLPITILSSKDRKSLEFAFWFLILSSFLMSYWCLFGLVWSTFLSCPERIQWQKSEKPNVWVRFLRIQVILTPARACFKWRSSFH